MTSYSHYIATMTISPTVSEINGDFSRKPQILPTPVDLTPPLTGVPLELGIGARGQKTGFHTSWKVMKVLKFKKEVFQAWKVMENDCDHGKVMEFHQ